MNEATVEADKRPHVPGADRDAAADGRGAADGGPVSRHGRSCVICGRVLRHHNGVVCPPSMGLADGVVDDHGTPRLCKLQYRSIQQAKDREAAAQRLVVTKQAEEALDAGEEAVDPAATVELWDDTGAVSALVTSLEHSGSLTVNEMTRTLRLAGEVIKTLNPVAAGLEMAKARHKAAQAVQAVQAKADQDVAAHRRAAAESAGREAALRLELEAVQQRQLQADVPGLEETAEQMNAVLGEQEAEIRRLQEELAGVPAQVQQAVEAALERACAAAEAAQAEATAEAVRQAADALREELAREQEYAVARGRQDVERELRNAHTEALIALQDRFTEEMRLEREMFADQLSAQRVLTEHAVSALSGAIVAADSPASAKTAATVPSKASTATTVVPGMEPRTAPPAKSAAKRPTGRPQPKPIEATFASEPDPAAPRDTPS